MKKKLSIMILFMMGFSSYGADKICIVGSGISYSDGGYSYITGAGPQGALPNKITPLSKEVADLLERASKEVKTNVMICMEGSFLEIANDNYSFMVYSAKEEQL